MSSINIKCRFVRFYKTGDKLLDYCVVITIRIQIKILKLIMRINSFKECVPN